MTDDWNLKGKKLGYSYVISDMGERGYDFVRPEDIKNGEICYFKDNDIKTLRKKLIEDITNMDDMHAIDVSLLKIINNRFGVGKL